MLHLLVFCFAGLSPVTVNETDVQKPAIEVTLEQAREAMSEKRWADAHGLLKDAKKQDKKNPEVYLLLGDLQAALNKPSMAKSYYKKAQKLGADVGERVAAL